MLKRKIESVLGIRQCIHYPKKSQKVLLSCTFAINNDAMATKTNIISLLIPRNSLLFSSWLSDNGIGRKGQTLYVRSGWLERGNRPSAIRAFRRNRHDGNAPTTKPCISSRPACPN